MTTIAQKLKAAAPPFETHFVGKWHCGARSPANLPISRGFDTHLGFLKGMEGTPRRMWPGGGRLRVCTGARGCILEGLPADHFTQRSDFNMYAEKFVDLWNDEHPASNDLNGTCTRCFSLFASLTPRIPTQVLIR